MTASLSEIFRHPIKAHGAEALTTIEVQAGRTLPWDRHWAVLHEHAKADGSEWAPCANFSRGAKVASLMAISATFDDQDETIRLKHPDIGELIFDPNSETSQFLDWVRPLMPENRAASAAIVSAPERGMTDTPFPSISLGNHATLDALSDRLGVTLDPRRFRANFWIKGLQPWEEFDWIGKTLRIGDVAFRVEERITRCRATMANPETGKTDADTLGALEGGWNHTDFGIYIVAEGSGRVSVGDPLEVLA